MLLLVSCSGAEVDFARSLAVPQSADIVLRNGKIVTVDRNFSLKQAVAIKGGRFLFVGSDRDMRPFIGPSTRVIDLGGRTVIPGLIDAQIHATRAGLNWDGELHWEQVRSLADGLQMIAKAAQDRPAGSWIVIGGGWVPKQFVEQRFPTIGELDTIAPNHPVYLQYLDDDALLNNAGLRTVGITGKTAEPKGGKFERNASGELTGWLRGGPAWQPAYSKIPKLSLERARQSLRSCFAALNRFGVTSIADLQDEDVSFAERRVLADMARLGELTVRVNFYIDVNTAVDESTQVNSAAAEIKQLPQSDWFRFGGFVGNMNQGNLPANRGGSRSDPKEAFRHMMNLLTEGPYSFRLRLRHDSDVSQALAELEQRDAASLSRKRIAFTDFEGVSAQTIERIKKFGAGLVVESRALTGEPSLGISAMSGAANEPSLGSLLEAGLTLGIASNGFRSNNFSPMLTLWWLATGKSVAGTVIRGPVQKIPREQALRMYTMGGAWLNAESQRKGSIEVDKFADLVVLSGDYLTVPEDQIRSLESVLTMVGGRVVHFASPFGPIKTGNK
jgi:predicted amidohydrolase YtcJ